MTQYVIDPKRKERVWAITGVISLLVAFGLAALWTVNYVVHDGYGYWTQPWQVWWLVNVLVNPATWLALVALARMEVWSGEGPNSNRSGSDRASSMIAAVGRWLMDLIIDWVGDDDPPWLPPCGQPWR